MNAELPDIEYANAYLLGKEVSTNLPKEEVIAIEKFLEKISNSEESIHFTYRRLIGPGDEDVDRLHHRIEAFKKGVKENLHS